MSQQLDQTVRSQRFLAMPTSRVGRAAASLSLTVLVSVLLMAVIIEPMRPAWRDVFAVLIVLMLVSAATTGLIAVAVRRERSWAVVTPTLVFIAVILNEFVQQARM